MSEPEDVLNSAHTDIFLSFWANLSLKVLMGVGSAYSKREGVLVVLLGVEIGDLPFCGQKHCFPIFLFFFGGGGVGILKTLRYYFG